jgi:Concanavalin A-like lectin/glucanases superfamily
MRAGLERRGKPVIWPARHRVAVARRRLHATFFRTRPQLAALAFTCLVASLLLPLPWTSGAEAAQERVVRTGEVVELRSATSRTVRRADGSFATTLSQDSLHYLDKHENWQKIDATFKASSEQGTKWASGGNRFSVDVAPRSTDGFVTLNTRQGSVSLSLEDANPTGGVKSDRNEVVFEDALAGVDLEYVLLPDGLKENIVLNRPGAPSEYRFRLDPGAGKDLRAEERDDGSFWFFRENGAEPAFTLLAPVVGDSSDPQPRQGSQGHSFTPAAGMASLDVEEEGDGTFVLDLSIDEDWLRSEDRVYPIVLDPTFFIEQDIADGYYHVQNPNGNPNVTWTELLTGPDGAGGPRYASVVSFDIGAIPAAAQVLDADLLMHLNRCYGSGCGAESGDVHLRRLTSGWSATTPWSAITKDPAVLAQVSFASNPPVTWHAWSGAGLTTSVQSMVNGTLPNHGFIAEKSGGNDNLGWAWRSSRWSDPNYTPLLRVYWASDGVQIRPLPSVHSNGADLFWQKPVGGTGAYADAVLQDAPVGYWRLDEGGEPWVWDWSGKDNLGVIQDTPGVVRADPGPLADGNPATRFLSTLHGYVKVYDDPTLRVNDTFTLEAWVRRSDLVPRNLPIFNDFGSGYWLEIDPGTSRLELLGNGNGASIAMSTTTIADTAWHHVAATKAGASVKLYIDGTDVTGTVTNQTLVSSTSGFHIGQTDGLAAGNAFYGSIDEAAVYPTALSAARIQAHYGARAVPIAGFVRYDIHRSATPNFTPSASTLIGAIGDASVQMYRDTTAKPSTTFYYEVVTVTAEGSFSSNELKAELPPEGNAQVTFQPGFLTGGASGTHISSGAPNSVAGNSQTITVGSSASNHTRALISFHMHLIPTWATITSAKLQMYALGSSEPTNLHRVTSSWLEGGATSTSTCRGRRPGVTSTAP